MPAAGDIIRAADVARTIHEARCTTSTIVDTTTNEDITGATVTFTTSKANVKCVVVGTADVDLNAAGYGTALVGLDVDGTDQTALIVVDESAVRVTAGQVWNLTLAAAGAHTLKLEGRITVASGSAIVRLTHTGFIATVYDVTS